MRTTPLKAAPHPNTFCKGGRTTENDPPFTSYTFSTFLPLLPGERVAAAAGANPHRHTRRRREAVTRPPAPRYHLVLVAVGGAEWASVPPAVRLRRALKTLGRRYGLRCVRAEGVAPAMDGAELERPPGMPGEAKHQEEDGSWPTSG